jgi:hypothetical protein
MPFEIQLHGSDIRKEVEKVIEEIPKGNVFAGQCDEGGLRALKEVAAEKDRTVTASQSGANIFFVVK